MKELDSRNTTVVLLLFLWSLVAEVGHIRARNGESTYKSQLVMVSKF